MSDFQSAPMRKTLRLRRPARLWAAARTLRWPPNSGATPTRRWDAPPRERTDSPQWQRRAHSRARLSARGPQKVAAAKSTLPEATLRALNCASCWASSPLGRPADRRPTPANWPPVAARSAPPVQPQWAATIQRPFTFRRAHNCGAISAFIVALAWACRFAVGHRKWAARWKFAPDRLATIGQMGSRWVATTRLLSAPFSSFWPPVLPVGGQRAAHLHKTLSPAQK